MPRQSWLLAFDYEKVTVYDELDRVVTTFPATSGKYHPDGTPASTITDQDRANLGPIPHGEYVLRPQEFSDAGVGRRLLQWLRDRNLTSPVTFKLGSLKLIKGQPIGADFGQTRVKLQPLNPGKRDEFFVHGGHFAGSLGCIDVGPNDMRLKELLQDQSGDVHVVVDYTPGKVLLNALQRARTEHRARVSAAPIPGALRGFAYVTGFFPPERTAMPPYVPHPDQAEKPMTPNASATPLASSLHTATSNDKFWKEMLDRSAKLHADQMQRMQQEAQRRQEAERQHRKIQDDIQRQQKELRELRMIEERRREDERRRREQEQRERERRDREIREYQDRERKKALDAQHLRQIQIEAGQRQQEREKRAQEQRAKDEAQRARDRQQSIDIQNARDKASRHRQELHEKMLKDEKERRDKEERKNKEQKININLH